MGCSTNHNIMWNEETIGYEGEDKDAWVCVCGNTPSDGGFATCDNNGKPMEPLIGSEWDDRYVCNICGRIIEGTSRRVVGKRPPQQ